MWNGITLTATTTVCNCFSGAVERCVCVLLLAISLTDYLMLRVIHVVLDYVSVHY